MRNNRVYIIWKSEYAKMTKPISLKKLFRKIVSKNKIKKSKIMGNGSGVVESFKCNSRTSAENLVQRRNLYNMKSILYYDNHGYEFDLSHLIRK